MFCISGVLKLFNIYIKHVRMFFTSQMQKLFFLVFSQECNHLLGNKQFFTENVYFEKTYYMPKQNWKSNKPKFFMSKLKLTKMPSSSCQKKKKKKMPSSFLPLKIYQVVVKVLQVLQVTTQSYHSFLSFSSIINDTIQTHKNSLLNNFLKFCFRGKQLHLFTSS